MILYLLTFISSSSYYCLVSIQRVPSCIPNLEKPNYAQTGWTRTWPRRYWKHSPWWLDGRMSSMSTPGVKPSGELEGCWPTYVCAFSFSYLQRFLQFINRFFYILYISIDVNIKLKWKDWGLEDVELMPGWGLFVEEAGCQEFISNCVDQPEASPLYFLI